jgi:hypothetical protein
MPLPQSFQDRLRQNKVLPFVGAGLSKGIESLNGDPLFPTWAELLAKAGERLAAENKPRDAQLVEALVAKGDLNEAARRAREGLGAAHWYDFLKAVFDRTADEADPNSLGLNRLIWTLGSNLVITTNYDRALQWACPERSDFRVWDIEAKVEQVAAIREGNVRRPTVWHLHGQIDNAANMVLTPDGYSRLYGSDTTETVYRAGLESLRTVLKSHSLLFVGFSLRDARFLAELTRLDTTYEGAASQHYILLPRAEAEREDVRLARVEVIAFEDMGHFADLVTAMAIQAQQSSPTYVRAQRYLVDRREGIYLFGGRGDAFFQLYDQAIERLRSELDIFSLKLSRFRQRHGTALLQLSQSVRIRIAILDPKFPLPRDGCSIASIRDREERAQNGAIMRDVAAWCDHYDRYLEQVKYGTLQLAAGCGLHIHLYNALPTINLFRADTSLFVGPYLLNVEDRHTPTFLIKGDTPERSMGRHLFKEYQAHFTAVWDASSTRCVSEVTADERLGWSRGVYVDALAS